MVHDNAYLGEAVRLRGTVVGRSCDIRNGVRTDDYAMADPAWLIGRLDQLKGLQSNETLERWRSLIARRRNFTALVEELLTLHYDPLYQRSQASNYHSFEAATRYGTDQLDAAALDKLAKAILAASV